MGVVYEAVHVDIDQRVAVKILRREYCNDPEVVRAFRAEARATAQIGTEFIAQVRDFLELPDGRLMIAMEFLEGSDLHQSTDGPMDPSRIIAILRQCCRGLAAVHDHGLVHRDVKPENIFLTSDNGREDKVKLLDFGIAMFVGGEAAGQAAMGTAGFLAPESITEGRIGPEMDQFALGSVAYSMLTGRPAFPGETVAEVLRATLQPLERPTDVPAETPQGLVDIVMNCLHIDPKRRYADMRQLEVALCMLQIEAGIHTPWDDLPLPEVDPDVRAWLLSHMPEPETGLLRSKQRRAVVFAFAGALALSWGGIAMAAAIWGEDAPTQEEQTAVDRLTDEARTAASRALYVYPSADEPDGQTAFQAVRQLEDLDNDAGASVATKLRAEFAQTLNRLGDTYWSADGGRAFATAYYEQAVLFDPSIEPAASRAGLSGAGAASLADRASRADFSTLELISAQPLTILANEDPDERAAEFEAYRSSRATKMDQLGSRLAGASNGRGRPPKKAAAAESPPVSAEDVAEEDVLIVSDEGAVGADAETGAPTGRAKAEAQAIAQKGQSAFRRGDDAKARVLYERALGLDDKNLTALGGLRDIAFDGGDYGRAVRYGKKVARLAPRRSSNHRRLGDAYYKLAKYPLAVKHYESAQKLGAKDVEGRLEQARQRLPSGR